VSINIDRCGEGDVAHGLLDIRGRNIRTEHKADKGMPQIMDADGIRKPGLSQRGLEVLNGISGTKWGAIPGAEYIGRLNPAVG
jgi:hypothetical protein